MTKCLKCGSELIAGKNFCIKCGQPIPQHPTFPQNSKYPQPTKTVVPGSQQIPQPKRPQAPKPFNQQMPQCPTMPKPQMACSIQNPQPKDTPENKGFFNRLGSGFASAMTGGSFSQGYDRQRKLEETNENIIDAIPYKIQDAQSVFRNIKKKYPNIVESNDEIEFQQLIDAVQNTQNDQTGNITQRNSRLKKVLSELDKKIYELKNKVNSINQNGTNNDTQTKPNIRTVELHDINQEECVIVENKATWGIQRGQIARRITERELDAVDGLKGVIIQQGCSAMVFVNGELVKTMDSGAYNLQVKSDSEMKKMIETLTNQLMENHKDKIISTQESEKQKINSLSIAQRGGLVGIASSWIKKGFDFVFGSTPVAKKRNKDEELEALKKFKSEAERIVKEENKQPLLSIILISNRHFNLTFGGIPIENGISFNPYVIPMGLFDVNIGIEVEMRIGNITDFATHYLSDCNSFTTNDVFKLLNFDIENTIRQSLRNKEYKQEGLDAQTRHELSQNIQASINNRLYGLLCTQILNITDSQDDVFGRFRQVEKEIYCSEKEIEYMTRTGEIRNRMEQEQNRQLLNSAQNQADYNQAILQIDKQGLLTDDEREEFVMLLETQRQIREATSKEEAYEKLLKLEGNRLVKEDELNAIKDAIEHDIINREEITNIMRIQSNRRVEMERQQSEWALDDSKQDHDWEREDLERKRSWGIEDEEREREWIREEREYDRKRNRLKEEDEYNFEKMMRNRNIEIEDHARIRAETIEDENRAYERQRQQLFDQDQIAASQSQRQMQNLEMAMKLQMMQEAQEQQHEKDLANIKSNEQINRDNMFANMTAEQIRAAQLSHLTGDAQVAAMHAYSSDKENNLLRQQALKDEERAKAEREAASKDKSDLMNFAMQMANMVKDTASSVSGARQDNQQQQIEQLRSDKERAENRQDHAQDQAFNAMGSVATAAASNLYTQNSNMNINQQYPPAPDVQQETFEYICYNCGHKVIIYQGMPKCPDCGAEFQW